VKYFVPMLLLIGVVVLMGGGGRDGFRSARSILFVLGFFLLLAIVFGWIVARAI
jgi:hypothetical protein